MIQCYEAVEGNMTQEFGKISKIKCFETIINDSSETSVWIGNWLAATSVSSLHVSPKYLKRHKKGWKHKTKLKTRYTVDLMLELTLIICQKTQAEDTRLRKKYNEGLSHETFWLFFMKSKPPEQREEMLFIFPNTYPRMPGFSTCTKNELVALFFSLQDADLEADQRLL